MSYSPSSRQQDTITLAKRGDPNLIETFLNYKLKSQGITARVRKKQHHLLVLLTKEKAPPDQPAMVNLLKKIAAKLDSQAVVKIRVCGQQQGDDIPSWLKVIEANSSITPKTDLKNWLDSVKITPDFLSNQGATPPIASQVGQRFLRFHLGEEDTALIAVNVVKEVLSVSGEKMLPVPDVNPSVLGIHNWRGEMLWVIDLNHLLGFPPLWEIQDVASDLNIIVLQSNHQEIGVAVPQVQTIEQHDWQKLQPPEGLFPPHILTYAQGYLTEASSIILDASALVKAFQTN